MDDEEEENDHLPLIQVELIDEEEDDDIRDVSDNEGDVEMSDEFEGETDQPQGDNVNNNEPQQKPKRDSKITFDTSLPSTHSYLGDDLEEVSGRTILEDESFITLPILQLPGIVLVPGQTIPLHLFNQHSVAMLKDVLDKDKTFGVVSYRHSLEAHGVTIAKIGTTAEIFSVHDDTDDLTGISNIKVKAKGRQRFEIIETQRSVTGVLLGKVKILPEIVVCDPLVGARPYSHCKYCCSPKEQDEVMHTAVDRHGRVIKSIAMINNYQIDKHTAARYTWWPPWVYKMYDAELVMQRTKTALNKWNETLKPEQMPNDPIELSYWMVQNLPLDDDMRVNLLSINNAIQRLRCTLSIIEMCSILCCKECETHITNKDDVFSLSIEGPLGAYVNPGGYVHEMMTVHKTHNLSTHGSPSTEHSWFPGYAWTILQCKRCSSHMGWKFTATKRSLKPQKFYGLTRASIVPGIKKTDDSYDEWMPVM